MREARRDIWCGIEDILPRLSLPGTERTLYAAMLKYGNASIPFSSPYLTEFSPVPAST
jgi:hypothetical protein